MTMTARPASTDRRHDVLQLLRAATEPMTLADLSARLGVHPNTVRFHLAELIRSGRAERVELPPTGPGRPPLAFRSVAGMDPAGPRNYKLLAAVLADVLRAAPDAEEQAASAGRHWGQRLAERPRAPLTVRQSVGRLHTVLDDLGFEPEKPTGGATGEIGLRHCPFLEVVQTDPTVACAVHLGVMQGALAAMDAPVTIVGLDPFVQPDRCCARFGPRAATPARARR